MARRGRRGDAAAPTPLPRVLVIATRDGERAERTVERGAHDALLAELLRDGWSIEAVRAP